MYSESDDDDDDDDDEGLDQCIKCGRIGIGGRWCIRCYNPHYYHSYPSGDVGTKCETCGNTIFRTDIYPEYLFYTNIQSELKAMREKPNEDLYTIDRKSEVDRTTKGVSKNIITDKKLKKSSEMPVQKPTAEEVLLSMNKSFIVTHDCDLKKTVEYDKKLKDDVLRVVNRVRYWGDKPTEYYCQHGYRI